MQRGVSLEELSFDKFRKILENNFREIDGLWYLPFQKPSNTKQGLGPLIGVISSETEVIGWLEDLLKIPKSYGEIAPEYFRALGSTKLKKDLKQILEENFVQDGVSGGIQTRRERKAHGPSDQPDKERGRLIPERDVKEICIRWRALPVGQVLL